MGDRPLRLNGATFQAPGVVAGDFHIHKLADPRWIPGKAHQAAALGASGEDAVLLPVHQDLHGFAHIAPVNLLGNSVLGGDQAIKPLIFLLAGHRIGHGGRRGALAGE